MQLVNSNSSHVMPVHNNYISVANPTISGMSTPAVNTRMAQPQAVMINRTPTPNLVTRGGLGGGNNTPILVQSTQQQVLRVQAPGGPNALGVGRPTTVPAAITQGRNIVINQPGLRPGTPGSQITVPINTLQSLQPGQGIPTGQAGHLLIKTENGQYQILKVGNSSAPGTGTITSVSAPASTLTLPQSQPQVRPVPASTVPQTLQQPRQPVAASQGQQRTPTTGSTSSSVSAASGGMGQQMTPDAAKIKCKNFLATLLRLASDQPNSVATNVRGLIQGLIDGRVEPELFTSRLQQELNSSPQPCLVPFLKKSLPHLQQSLRTGELTIEGVRAPTSSLPQSNPMPTAVRVQRPPARVIQQPTVQSVQRPRVPHVIGPGMATVAVASSVTAPLPTTNLVSSPIPGLPTSARSTMHLVQTPSTSYQERNHSTMFLPLAVKC